MDNAAAFAAPLPEKTPKNVGPLPDIMAFRAPVRSSSPKSGASAGRRATQASWRSFPARGRENRVDRPSGRASRP